ncbi:MAG: hypothetical protein RIK87_24155 [Fuerstiella sp.]
MTNQQRGSILRPAVTLTMAIAIGWVLCFWPARMLNGQTGVLWMSVAAICCLVPGWIVVFLAGLAIFPNDLATMLVQMSVRLATVGGAAVVVKKLRPEFGPTVFTIWLIVFYLLALFVEVYLLRSVNPASGSTADPEDGR